MNVSPLGRFELAARIALDEATGSWFVVGTDDEQAAVLLAQDLESLLDDAVAVVRTVDRESLVRASHAHASGVAIFFAPVELAALELDGARSLLQRVHPAILAVPTPELHRFATIAPHFASWAGNRAFVIEDDRFLDHEAQEERLQALREHYGMSDEQLVTNAERGELVLEPEHTEWLVLIGRQDLLEGKR